jgi:hypothetical protein
MRVRSAIGANDSRTRTIGRGTHARRPAGDIGFVLPDFATTAGGKGSVLKACPAEIGFVLPNSTQPRSGGDRGPRIACPAETGFVPPKPTQLRGGGDRGPGIAAWPRRGRAPQGIERPDCGFPPRQRAPLVAVEPHQPGGGVGRRKTFPVDLRTQSADALNVDLRLGDPERGGAARLARALPGDPLRQRCDLGGKRRVGQHRQAQPMAQRVARHRGLAGARARPGAARRVGAVGGADCGGGHEGASTAGNSRLRAMRPPASRSRVLRSIWHGSTHVGK